MTDQPTNNKKTHNSVSSQKQEDTQLDEALIDLYESAMLHGEAQANGVLPTQYHREQTIILTKAGIQLLIEEKLKKQPTVSFWSNPDLVTVNNVLYTKQAKVDDAVREARIDELAEIKKLADYSNQYHSGTHVMYEVYQWVNGRIATLSKGGE